ncbi:tripartite tricarboxylate transporter TctB family protein [Paraburkholderia sp. BCC1884]|uniref:tripartite tricarboxylate transporter TctB family protein n=1 Tax=Paraburkholderia sp. BCC1884 TaxID=2562668 RepID=UPI001183956A|nr:tripartite tricarboxylate transporter TctB family protein [Paraburkholderia sp. BCC1884]
MLKAVTGIPRDYFAGGLMFLLGLGAIAQGASYTIGTLTDMGPGFFPVALGTMLTLAGISIVVVAKLSVAPRTEEARPAPEWVAWSCILAGIAAFVVLGKYGGLVPATCAAVFISALGDRQNTWKSALVLAAAMGVIAAVVFRWALQLQFPLFSWG